ncbi:hypothetical protein [Acidipropionibacterium acidipropionici]|uniref:hypothetical protein n=1 Tax=Acidipropionibacterium acidipropionici TaxID=1748 RepID=UPI000F7DF107|nr:hypothetical protein [Acidipropionibacterium acidipropionici]
MELNDEPSGQQLDPMSRVLNAALDLAREEASGRVLDGDELAVVDLCDDIGDVRGIAEHEAQMESSC